MTINLLERRAVNIHPRFHTSAGNALPPNNQSFSTKDRDNDMTNTKVCTSIFHGAWWYNQCGYSNLNGKYFKNGERVDNKGIVWHTWKNNWKTMKRVSMKIRRNH